MKTTIILPSGRKAEKAFLENGIMLFSPNERGDLVDTALKTIPQNEHETLISWMNLNGNGLIEKYYLFLLAVAEAASRRGDISRDHMLEVFRDIQRGGTIQGVLL